MKQSLLPVILMASAIAAARADVTLPPLISDNMLIQSGTSAVWGKADPGENVTVQLGKTVSKTTAGSDGKWRVKLEGLKPGILGDMAIAGKNKVVIQNVAVGDVWVCSGQSNMEFALNRVNDAQKEQAEANYPGIRVFTVPHTPSETPADDLPGKWQVCTPQGAACFPAAGYFFGRKLHQDLGIPIGLVHSSWGGSAAHTWTPKEALKADPDLKATYWDGREAELANYPALYAAYLPKYQAAVEKAKAEGKPIPRKVGPRGPNCGPSPTAAFNGMIFGATPYAIKGAIWYQGEANVGIEKASAGERYHRLLPAMIGAWRKAWNQGEFPFYIVQLPNWQARLSEPADSYWAILRESQYMVSKEIPNVGLAVTIDIGDAADIHPKNKQEVGRRLALAAEAKTYGKKVVYTGPDLDEVKFEGATAKVTFKPGSDEGLATSDKAEVKGFAIAGEDRKFVWAKAQIVVPKPGAPSIVLSSPQVPHPVAVRYAWANNPEVNLVNQAGLPAVPFRTDNWPQEEPPAPGSRAVVPTPVTGLKRFSHPGEKEPYSLGGEITVKPAPHGVQLCKLTQVK